MAEHKSPILKRDVNDFWFLKIIGEGSFSTVFLAKEIDTSKLFAIKVMDKKHIIKFRKTSNVKREKEILQILTAPPASPFFVKLYCTFQDYERLFITMTYAAHGDILHYINVKDLFDLDISRFYTMQLVCALKHLNTLHIVHRDLKPENILLDRRYRIQLTDFGSAIILKPITPIFDEGKTATNTDKNNNESTENIININENSDLNEAVQLTNGPANTRDRHSSFVGTAQYVSPEVLTNKPISYTCDLWALGCILYQFVAGSYPFRAANEYHIFQKILGLNYTFPLSFDAEAKDLVQKLLHLESAERLGSPSKGGFAALEAHPFFANHSSSGYTFENVSSVQSPLEVRLSTTGTFSNIESPTAFDDSCIQYVDALGKIDNEDLKNDHTGDDPTTKLTIKPGLGESELSRLHGLNLLQDAFSNISVEISDTMTAPHDAKPFVDGLSPRESANRLLETHSEPKNNYVVGSGARPSSVSPTRGKKGSSHHHEIAPQHHSNSKLHSVSPKQHLSTVTTASQPKFPLKIPSSARKLSAALLNKSKYVHKSLALRPHSHQHHTDTDNNNNANGLTDSTNNFGIDSNIHVKNHASHTNALHHNHANRRRASHTVTSTANYNFAGGPVASPNGGNSAPEQTTAISATGDLTIKGATTKARKHSLPLSLTNTEASSSSSSNLSGTHLPHHRHPHGIPSFKKHEKSSSTEELSPAALTAKVLAQNYQFLTGQKIAHIGILFKRVGLFAKKRIFVLSRPLTPTNDTSNGTHHNSNSTPPTNPNFHLAYIDPETMVLKGEIPWNRKLRVDPKNFKNFHVHTPNRVYYLEDPEGYALRWSDAINALLTQT